MNRLRLGLCAILLSGFPFSVGLAADVDLGQPAAQAAQGSFREWLEFLAIPNDSITPVDIQRNVAWLIPAFEKRGFSAQALANADKPMLFAHLRAPAGTAPRKTVLFYAHLDGQPVTPSQWAQPSPWQPVLKTRNAEGKWSTIPTESLYSNKIDSEWRIFARSASDDKAPIIMLLAAIDALKAAGKHPAFDIKVILDSEEEKSSPSLPTVIRRNLDLLKSDAMVIIDGPAHPSNRPTLMFGNRGVLKITLKVFGPKKDLHSGHYGNYVPNPAYLLSNLLAGMKDDNGRVTIPGYYDMVKIDDYTRNIMRAVPDDLEALHRQFGIAKPDRVGETLQEALQYPSLNIRGLKAGDVGTAARTIIPADAVAELDLRTVPESRPNALADLVRGYIESRGFHLVDGEPTDAERAQYPRLASMRYSTETASSEAVRTDYTAPIANWLRRALTRTYGAEPVQVRMMGGTVPTGSAVTALNVPFAIFPLVNYDNNQHSFDENMRIGNYIAGVQGLIGLLQEPFEGDSQ